MYKQYLQKENKSIIINIYEETIELKNMCNVYGNNI